MKVVYYLGLLFLLFIGCKPVQNVDIVISNINVIDVKSGKVINNQDVAIIGRLIVDIQNHDEKEYRADQLIYGGEKFLIPGLWDMHVHTGRADIFFPLYVANGITGVRDMGGGIEQSTGNSSVKFEILSKWRTEVLNGTRVGPEILLASSMVDGTPPTEGGSIEVTDSSSIYETVRSQKQMGVDFVKVYHNLTPQQLEYIADAAEKYEIDFAGHIPLLSPPLPTLLHASDLGQKSIEHLMQIQSAIPKEEPIVESFMDVGRACSQALDDIDLEKERRLYEAFRANQTWLTTTVSVWWGMGQLDQQPNHIYQKWLEYIPSHIREKWTQNPFKDEEAINHLSADYQTFRTAALSMAKLAKRMNDNGLNLLGASDSANPGIIPGFGLHKELELLVAGGFTPLEALRLVTLNPAKFMDRTDIGNVAPNMLGNLVILNKNPLQNISNLTEIQGVILNGEFLDRRRLDELLNKAMQAANKN